MLKVVTIEHFKVIPAAVKGLPDHALLIERTPPTGHPEGDLQLPKVLTMTKPWGISDYTDFTKNFKLKVIMDDEAGINDDMITTEIELGHIATSFLVFPEPREIIEVDPSTKENDHLVQGLNESQTKSEYKIMRSNDGQTSIAVSDKSIVLKSGNTRFIVSDGQIMRIGDVVDYNLPSQSQGIVKETGMLRLLPKAFIPPFCFPDYLPDTEMVFQVSKMLKTVSDLKNLLKSLK